MSIKDDVIKALEEDIGAGDVTSALLPVDLSVKAKIISREPMLVCGIPWVNEVFNTIDKKIAINWLVTEGSWQDSQTTLCEVYGLAQSILTAERTALNFLQTLSGTATITYQYVKKIAGYKTKLLDTRKTLPGLRMAQKYAVFTAGGCNHRMGLYDAYLIKENHISACGSIKSAINRARELNKNLFIEVEVENISELKEALEAKPNRIMLDNFTIPMINEAVIVNAPYNCELEVSGNVDLDTIDLIAKTNVDYISVGSLTKSVKAIDLSLLIVDA
jgi:nicotinate-nucleotide pyrophosphorylase (carboxylating)